MSPARVLSFLALIGAAACSSDDEGTDEICSTEHVIDDVEESVGPDGQVVVSDAPRPAATTPSGY